MAEYVPVGGPANESERRGIKCLRDRLPNHYIVIGNFDLELPRRTNTFEYDAVVIGEWGLFAVEIKGWGGRIEGDPACWNLEWGRVKNPFILIEQKAKALRDLLVKNIDDFPDDLFCESAVYLPREDVEIDIEDPRNDRLVIGDQIWDFFVRDHVDRGPGKLREEEFRQEVRRTIIPRAEPGSTAPQIPNYVVEKELERPGVPYREYLGTHEMLESRGTVRIKAYSMDPLLSRSKRKEKFKRAKRDLEALAALEDDPYIARAYELHRDDEDELLLYLVSEWVGPQTLGDYIEGCGGERAAEQAGDRLELAAHVVRAVDRVHGEGVVHRNVSPEVFYMTADDESDVPIRLADFDYARISQLQSITGGISEIGTEGYVAPEVWNGDAHDRRADIYSLGIVLYELLVGEPLFEGISEILNYEEVWQERRRNIRWPNLRKTMDRMLQGDPTDRLEDLDEVVENLKAVERMRGRPELESA